MHRTLLRRAEPYSSPGTLGTGSRIPITNCSYSGLCHLLAWTAFSVTPAIHLACRQSNSLESRSVRLPSNMAPNSDKHSSVLRTFRVMRFPRLLAAIVRSSPQLFFFGFIIQEAGLSATFPQLNTQLKDSARCQCDH